MAAPAKPELKTLGFWWSEQEPELPRPQDLVGRYRDAELKRKLRAYLDAGTEYASYLGFSSCRFDCGIPISRMGCRDLSDGVWAWPEGLSHYVDAHDVLLPSEFLEHGNARGWAMPPNVWYHLAKWSPAGGGPRPELRHAWWLAWAKSRAKG